MDKVGYLAANSAAMAMARMENVANNMANINTNGFRATVMALQSTPLLAKTPSGEALDTRTFAAETVVGFDNAPGVMQQTGRLLDMAIKSTGWFAIQRPDGTEGYSRAGSFLVNQDGILVNNEGLQVLGQGGDAIELPEGTELRVSETGLITAFDNEQQNFVEIAQLRLINPPPEAMKRGLDGYFEMADGQQADQAADVRVVTGYIEGSNVNPASAIVEMIAAQRSFDMSMKAVATAKEDDQKADGLVRSGG